MRRGKLSGRHEDTYQRLSFEKQTMALSSLVSGLSRFLEERYRDAYTLEHGELHGYLEVSVEGVALILREALLAILGKSTARISVEADGVECRITLSSKTPASFDERMLGTLYATAARSGVRLTVKEGSLLISCAISEEMAFAVYAYSSESFYSMLVFTFDEI